MSQQYVLQNLPFSDQLMGAALLQLITRLGIPMGIGITTAIWSSWFPTPDKATTNSNVYPLTTLQAPYLHVFIATLAFTGVAALVVPFAPLGRLGVASTATNSSLPREETGLKNINLDGHGDWSEMQQEHVPQNGVMENTCPVPCGTRFKIQPRMSSLLGTSLNNEWRRMSTGAASFRLPHLAGPRSRASGDASGIGLGIGLSDDDNNDDDNVSQHTNTVAMAQRVIWLVCEDCGASKRIIEPVGDPGRYFYDADEVEETCDRKTAVNDRALTSPAPSSKYSSVTENHETSVAEVGVLVDGRRFQLVNGPGAMGSVAEVNEE